MCFFEAKKEKPDLRKQLNLGVFNIEGTLTAQACTVRKQATTGLAP